MTPAADAALPEPPRASAGTAEGGGLSATLDCEAMLMCIISGQRRSCVDELSRIDRPAVQMS
jgi:hypothetical protein